MEGGGEEESVGKTTDFFKYFFRKKVLKNRVTLSKRKRVCV